MSRGRRALAAWIYLAAAGCGTDAPEPLPDLPVGSDADTASTRQGDTQPPDLSPAPDVEPDVSPPPFGEVTLDPEAKKPPLLLSSTQLIRWDGAKITYHPEAFPYTINMPLFSDYALKDRAIWIPLGSAAAYEPNAAFAFPPGTIVLKSFLYLADLRAPDENLRLIETRLLVMTSEG